VGDVGLYRVCFAKRTKRKDKVKRKAAEATARNFKQGLGKRVRERK